MKITRAALTEAIEKGIAAEPRLTDAQAQALGAVAATTTHVATGASSVHGCGCPLVQAGLWDENASELSNFYSVFDRQFPGHETVLEVIE